jgi:hypothetical protein
MSKKLASSAALIVLIVSLSIVPKVQYAKADETRVAGVSIGDWWEYDLNFTLSTTSNSIPLYNLLNNTDWMRCTVLDVSGTNVTFQQIYHLENGTERDVIGLIDITSGHSNASSSFMINPYIIISANLTPGEPIYTEQYSAWKINATVPKTYVGTQIQTNLLNISTSNDLITLYYDKNTGIFVYS